jgi:hypothetical protein
VFIRRHFQQPIDHDSELRNPAPLILAIVAMVGWLLVAYFASQIIHMHASLYDALGRPDAPMIVQGCGSDL